MASRVKAVRELSVEKIVGPATTEPDEGAEWIRTGSIADAVQVTFGETKRNGAASN
jgi:hypothetical protein